MLSNELRVTVKGLSSEATNTYKDSSQIYKNFLPIKQLSRIEDDLV